MNGYVYINIGKNEENSEYLNKNYDLIIFYKDDIKRKILRFIFKILGFKNINYVSNKYILREDFYKKYEKYSYKEILIKVLEYENVKIKEVYDERSKISFLDFILYFFYSLDILRFSKFLFAGFLGLIFNLGVLYIFKTILKYPFYISSIVAIELSILFVFALNDIFVFRDRRFKKLHRRIIENNLIRIGTSILQYLLALFFYYILLINYLISQALSIIIIFILNYIFSRRIIWKIY